jgi:hypothetical protein
MSDGVVTPRPVVLPVCAAVLRDVTALGARRTMVGGAVFADSSRPATQKQKPRASKRVYVSWNLTLGTASDLLIYLSSALD